MGVERSSRLAYAPACGCIIAPVPVVLLPASVIAIIHVDDAVVERAFIKQMAIFLDPDQDFCDRIKQLVWYNFIHAGRSIERARERDIAENRHARAFGFGAKVVSMMAKALGRNNWQLQLLGFVIQHDGDVCRVDDDGCGVTRLLSGIARDKLSPESPAVAFDVRVTFTFLVLTLLFFLRHHETFCIAVPLKHEVQSGHDDKRERRIEQKLLQHRHGDGGLAGKAAGQGDNERPDGVPNDQIEQCRKKDNLCKRLQYFDNLLRRKDTLQPCSGADLFELWHQTVESEDRSDLKIVCCDPGQNDNPQDGKQDFDCLVKYDDQCVGHIQVEILLAMSAIWSMSSVRVASMLVQVSQMVATTAASETVVTTS